MRPPLADPFGPPALETDESRIFRQSFWRVYVGILLLTVFVVVPLIGCLWWFLMPQMFVGSGRSSSVMCLVFVVVINPLTSALSAVLRPLRVTRFGVQGPPIIGFVEWNQMQSVRCFWLGYSCARIRLRNRFTALLIPLALTDLSGFARTLEAWAPEDNPLRILALKRAS